MEFLLDGRLGDFLENLLRGVMESDDSGLIQCSGRCRVRCNGACIIRCSGFSDSPNSNRAFQGHPNEYTLY